MGSPTSSRVHTIYGIWYAHVMMLVTPIEWLYDKDPRGGLQKIWGFANGQGKLEKRPPLLLTLTMAVDLFFILAS